MSPLLKKASFDSSKCTSLLELTLKRIKILRNKRLIIAKQSKDDVAKLLQKGQESNALARVEYAFREANIAGAYDILEQYCQLIIKRISAIKSQQDCPSELKEAVASLIYAAPRCGDLQELQKLRDILTSKYGAEYSAAALELHPESSVNQQIIQKLSSQPPNSDTRLKLLKDIATEYRIDWNYQKAVAASFQSGETLKQDKQKVSASASKVSKGAGSTDELRGKSPYPVPMQTKEQTNRATHIAPPSKSKNTDFPRANQASDEAQHPPVAGRPKPAFDSLHRDGGHENQTAQNTSPSTQSSSPKPRESMGTSKRPIVGSPTTFDKNEKPDSVPMFKVHSKENETLPGHADAVPWTIHTAASRQNDLIGASAMGSHTTANKQKPSLMYSHHDELKGQPSIANPSQNSKAHYEGKGFASPSPIGTPGLVDNLKRVSVVAHQDGLLKEAKPVAPLWNDNKLSRQEAFVNPIQVPTVNVHISSERNAELYKVKGQAISAQDVYQAGAFVPRPRSRSLLNQETDGTAESLAAIQYMRAQKSYVEADTSRGKEDHRIMENSGFNLQRKRGEQSPHVDPYVRLREEGKMDYKNISQSNEQVQEPKRTPRAMDVEENRSLHEYYAIEQPKGTHYRRGSNRLNHEDASLSQISKEKEWEVKNAFGPQGQHQVEGISFNNRRNRSTLPELSKGFRTRQSTHSELRHDLADLEAASESAFASAAHAADAAKAAIDMVRTSSMRSKAGGMVGDVKASQREAYQKTSFSPIRREGHRNAEGIQQRSDAIEDEHERKHYERLSTRAGMTSLKAEAQDAPGVEKKTLSRSTQDTSITENQELYKQSNEPKKQDDSHIYRMAQLEQKPEVYDSEMPQFDDSSSDESNEEEAPFYTRGRAAIARKVDVHESMSPSLEQGPVNVVDKSVHYSAKKNIQQDFSESLNDDDCAESVEFLSTESYSPQFDEYEQSENAAIWSSGTPMRSHVSEVNTRKTNVDGATHYQDQHGHSLASYGYFGNGAIKWGPSVPEQPTRDVSKQRWTLTAPEEVTAKLPVQAQSRASRDDHSAIATRASQAATGKHFGTSHRSVRSSRPT